MSIMNVNVSQVRVGKRLRGLREETIPSLMESIKREGLRQPITVTMKELPFGHDPRIAYPLVAGLRRLTACRRLGWEKIPVQVIPASDETRIRIWEIDENLERQELNELELSEHLAERKRLYEQENPKSKHGVAGGLAAVARRRNEQTTPVSSSGFGVDFQDKIGVSERQIQRLVRRAEKIPKRIRDRIHELPEIANNGRELDALTKLSEEDQAKVVQLVAAGRAANIRQARGMLTRRRPIPEQRPSPTRHRGSEQAFRVVCGIFKNAHPVDRERILTALLEEAGPELRERVLSTRV